MSRGRPFCAATMAATLVLVAVRPSRRVDAPGAPSARPNILLILTDDQRWHGMMGVLPAVRRWFVRRGASYPDAVATTPLCCPSRASIFTGRYDVRAPRAGNARRPLPVDTGAAAAVRPVHDRVGPYGQAAVRPGPRSDRPTFEFFRNKELRSLMSVDDLVEHVVAELRADRELGHTLVVFLSDNGTMWGAHGLMGKGVPYLPSIRIPMFARWPGHLEPGSVDPRIVASIDLAPAMLAAAGISPDLPVPMDGRSFLDPAIRTRILTEYWRLRNPPDVRTWASTVTPDFQYAEYYTDGGAVSSREYYNVTADPWLVNLLGDRSTDTTPTSRRSIRSSSLSDPARAGHARRVACTPVGHRPYTHRHRVVVGSPHGRT
jgi:hypothetical protein